MRIVSPVTTASQGGRNSSVGLLSSLWLQNIANFLVFYHRLYVAPLKKKTKKEKNLFHRRIVMGREPVAVISRGRYDILLLMARLPFDSLTTALRTFRVTMVGLLLLVLSGKKQQDTNAPLLLVFKRLSAAAAVVKKAEEKKKRHNDLSFLPLAFG